MDIQALARLISLSELLRIVRAVSRDYRRPIIPKS